MNSVLFVSHDADLRAVASRVLMSAGFRVTAAAHAGHVTLACMTGTFDVLVVERRMADGTSEAVADRFQRHNPQANIVWIGDEKVEGPGHPGVARPFDAYDLIGAVSDATHYARRLATNL